MMHAMYYPIESKPCGKFGAIFSSFRQLKSSTQYQIGGQIAASAFYTYLFSNFSFQPLTTSVITELFISVSGLNLSYGMIRENKNKYALLGFALFAIGTTLLYCQALEASQQSLDALTKLSP